MPHVEEMWNSVGSRRTILPCLGMAYYKQIHCILGEIRIVKLTKHESQ